MSLDPSLLTPAAVKARMQQEQTMPRVDPQFLSPGSNIKPAMSMPRVDSQFLSPGSDLATTPEDDAFAKQLGTSVLGSTLENTNPEAIASMATDNVDDVDDSVKDIYSGQTDFAQILGALTSMGLRETATENLLKEVSDEKVTPESARKKVNEFFKIDTDKETPVWADVALTVGLSLLRGEGGEGKFLSDLGVAGERGLKVAQTRRKEKKAEDLYFDKLAFGVYREDEKSRKTLISQLTKQLGEEQASTRDFKLKVVKVLQKQTELSQKEAEDKSDAITNTIGTFSSDLKNKALPIIAEAISSETFANTPTDQIPSTIYGLLKNKGIKLDEIADAKNISPQEITISDRVTFDRYKAAFPKAFPFEYVEGKDYKIEGFADKSKPAGEIPFTNIMGVKPSIGGQDELTRDLTLLAEVEKALLKDPKNPQLLREKEAYEGRIKITTTTKEAMTYVIQDGRMVAAGPGAAGALNAADAVSTITDLNKQGNSLAAAFGLGDNILRSLASTPSPADSVGVIANVSKFIGGARGQLDAFTNTFGANASDNQNDYFNGTITTAMTNSTQRAVSEGLGSSRYTVGQVFKRLEEVTKGNTEIKSQLMSFAYALAGSRETGKLTDKDVAAALVTFGGGDIAEGKWFANPNVLVTGINQALDTATNAYAVKYNRAHSAAGNIKYLREVEKLSDAEIQKLTKFSLNKFLKENEGIREGLADRVSIVNGRIQFQNLDKYRGDGAGNVDGTSGLSSDARAAKNFLNSAAARTRLDPSDPNYLSPAKLKEAFELVPQNIRDELKQAGDL